MTQLDHQTVDARSAHPTLTRGVWLRACSGYVPAKRVSTEEAIANGWYSREDHAKDDYVAIAVEEQKWPGEMARLVGRAALREAGVNGDAVGLLTYASIHRHGNARLWQPAAYLQTALDAQQAIAFSLSHGCNGLFVAARLAIDYLHNSGPHDALLIGADRFGSSSLDRWQGDYGVLYGDAAVAVLLSNTRGFARVLHCELESVPMLEGMHRHSAEHDENDPGAGPEYGVRQSKKAFVVRHGRDYFFDAIRDALMRLRAGLLAQFDLLAEPVDWLITPNIGRAITDPLYAGVFADLAREHFGDMGRHVGHTGTADQFLALAELVQQGLLKPGQRVLLIGAGAGFSCSAMLVSAEDLVLALPGYNNQHIYSEAMHG